VLAPNVAVLHALTVRFDEAKRGPGSD